MKLLNPILSDGFHVDRIKPIAGFEPQKPRIQIAAADRLCPLRPHPGGVAGVMLPPARAEAA